VCVCLASRCTFFVPVYIRAHREAQLGQCLLRAMMRYAGTNAVTLSLTRHCRPTAHSSFSTLALPIRAFATSSSSSSSSSPPSTESNSAPVFDGDYGGTYDPPTPQHRRRGIYWLVLTVATTLPALLYFHGETKTEIVRYSGMGKVKLHGNKKKGSEDGDE